MATALDLQEQEQIDAVKAFWNQYGGIVTMALVLAALLFAGWTGWRWYQSDQGLKAGALFEQADRAALAGEVDKLLRVQGELRERYPRTVYARQAALMAARVLVDKGRGTDAVAPLEWVASADGGPPELADVARLRLAGLYLDAKRGDDARKVLAQVQLPEFKALADDRRGDAELSQDKRAEATAAFQSAWSGLDAQTDYRQVVNAKLMSLGAPPGAASAASAP